MSERQGKRAGHRSHLIYGNREFVDQSTDTAVYVQTSVIILVRSIMRRVRFSLRSIILINVGIIPA